MNVCSKLVFSLHFIGDSDMIVDALSKSPEFIMEVTRSWCLFCYRKKIVQIYNDLEKQRQRGICCI